MWVIGGYDGNTKNDVWNSSDGITWTQASASASWNARVQHSSVVFDNKMRGIGGEYKNDVWWLHQRPTKKEDCGMILKVQ